MRYIAITVLLLGLTVPAASAAAPRPVLRATALAPLAIKGMNFRAGERVTLLLAGDGVATKRVLRANAQGRFAAKFSLRVDRCTGYVLQAIGRRGSRATLERLTPNCIEP